MTALAILSVAGLVLAAVPAVLTLVNLPRFRPAPPPAALPAGRMPAVSVLVPARNEEQAIGRCASGVLANRDVELELLVLDDDSTDGTAERVGELARHDARVRLIRGRPLPAGWCGKQHACGQLADAARADVLVFLDCDVTLSADAVGRAVAFLDCSGAALVSGFPRQATGAFLDWLLLPLIHFLLLGYLPLGRSRIDNSPGLAAGCGQLFITRAGAYRTAGGHAAIRASLHDGLMLPRAYRRSGLKTDVFDAGDIASCRMYQRSRDVLTGLAKNATEGIGSPPLIVPFTVLLAGGQIVPCIVAAAGVATGFAGWPSWMQAVAWGAVTLVYLPRAATAAWLGQSPTAAAFHPLAVAVFLAIQWTSLARRVLGLKTRWRGRELSPQ